MSISGFRRAALGALVVAALAGCSHVPVTTALKLASFDPMTTDPAALRAAVAMPVEALPAKGGAKLVLTQARRDGSDEDKLELALEEVPLAAETGLAAVRSGPGRQIRAFRIAAADVPRLVETRQRMAARRAAEPGAFRGALSVGVDGCSRAGAPMPKSFRVSTWLKTAETGEYVTLLDDVDLVPLIGEEKFRAEAKVCPAG
jgi:hypothetical protein